MPGWERQASLRSRDGGRHTAGGRHAPAVGPRAERASGGGGRARHDPPGETLQGGLLRVDRDGGFDYRTPVGFVGVDRFQYGLFDGYGSWDVGEVTVGVGVPA